MYEEISHATLNRILDQLNLNDSQQGLRHFYSRLGANFYAIYSLFYKLYGARSDFNEQLTKLVSVMASAYVDRCDAYRHIDRAREEDHEWFLSQQWVGMALYANGFSENLKDLKNNLGYFSELGVNLIHILPILECPVGKSDGGYAVSNFRKVDPRLGTNSDLAEIIEGIHQQEALITLDIVVNHVSSQHEWAQKAMAGDEKYQDYFYLFDSRDIPDMFEQTMQEVFPETDPGNFTWNEDMKKWVMTVFHNYQWDLNYMNPEVFIEMLDIILYWANHGVDILRLDAVAFLWKKMGSISQNEDEAHLILQLFKDCCQVVAPGMIFIAEAIVAPSEVVKYFGEDAVVAKECEIAYNATFMALLWDSVATKNAKILNNGLKNIPQKFEGATWLNYLRCHDDIGFAFDDDDIRLAGYDPYWHRRFLIDYFSGNHEQSFARGKKFAENEKTGDARISGSLASLVGLERALSSNDQEAIKRCCDHILVLHSMIMSFGGIPLLYYGDEVGTLNDYEYLEDENKAADSRWIHRPKLCWQQMEQRHVENSIQHRLFSGLQRLIGLRKSIPAFADLNNREMISVSNDAIIAFHRHNFSQPSESIIVVANLSDKPQTLPISDLADFRYRNTKDILDLWSGKAPRLIYPDQLVLSSFQFLWLRVS